MTFKQLQKMLSERRIVLTMNYAVRKKAFFVQASQWNKPVARCEDADLEKAVSEVLEKVKAFKPLTPEEKAERRLAKAEKEYFDGVFGRKS